jgi:hypothetical protein
MMTYQFEYGQPYTIPIYGWYLEGGDKRILVDTGEMRPLRSESREAAIGGPIRTFADALAGFGLTPAAIDVVVHTHLHNDHCENAALGENAVFYVHERELAHASDPHPLDYRYNDEYIEDVRDAGQMIPLTGDTDIVPGLRMVPHTPAHTEGGMSRVRGHAGRLGRDHRFLRHPGKPLPAQGHHGPRNGGHSSRHLRQHLAAYDILRRIRQAATTSFPCTNRRSPRARPSGSSKFPEQPPSPTPNSGCPLHQDIRCCACHTRTCPEPAGPTESSPFNRRGLPKGSALWPPEASTLPPHPLPAPMPTVSTYLPGHSARHSTSSRVWGETPRMV